MRTDTSATSPTVPFHLAKAYNLRPPSAGQAPQPNQPAQQAAPTAGLTSAPQQLAPSVADQLVAGVVPGGIEFDDAGAAVPSQQNLPLYRSPAQHNAAATLVEVGRMIDVIA